MNLKTFCVEAHVDIKYGFTEVFNISFFKTTFLVQKHFWKLLYGKNPIQSSESYTPCVFKQRRGTKKNRKMHFIQGYKTDKSDFDNF